MAQVVEAEGLVCAQGGFDLLLAQGEDEVFFRPGVEVVQWQQLGGVEVVEQTDEVVAA